MCFGMLTYRAWEIRTLQFTPKSNTPNLPDVSFRHIEKNMLYLTKHIIQAIVLTVVKYWFIITTKGKKWAMEKWPKVESYLKKKSQAVAKTTPPSFVKRAILESKTKIRRIKEKVKREHE